MTAKALVKRGDLRRWYREAEKLGAKKLSIRPDGTVDIVIKDDISQFPTWKPDEPDQEQPRKGIPL